MKLRFLKNISALLPLLLLVSCTDTNNDTPTIYTEITHLSTQASDYYSVTAKDDGVFAVINNDFSLGLLSADGTVLLPCEYATARDVCDGVVAVRNENGNWGYYNVETRQMILPCEYETVYNFSEGIGCYFDGTYYRYINTDGSPAMETDFLSAGMFSDGLARAMSFENYGYINHSGEFELYCDYDYFDDFHDGLARVSNGKSFGYMDKTGEVKFQMNCSSIYNFKDGLAQFVSYDGLSGYVNTSGEIVIEPKYTALPSNMSDEYFQFRDGISPVMKDGKFGFIDTKGNLVIDTVHENIYFPTDGIVRVRNNNLYGYIAADGTQITECIYHSASPFKNGVARVEIDGKFTYINRKGETITDETFIAATEFSGDTAMVIKENTDKWSFVTKK